MRSEPVVGVAALRVESRPIEGCEPWTKLTVPCPRRGPIGLEVCVDCEHFRRLNIDPDSNEMVLSCEPNLTGCSLRLVENAAGTLPPESTPVSVLLDERQLLLRAELGVHEVATVFVSRDLAHAAVVNEHARAIGVLSRGDLLRWCSPGKSERRRTVQEIMGPVGPCLPKATSIAAAAAVLTRGNYEYATVVSDAGSALGVLSACDLLGWFGSTSVATPSNR
jgi:predicted transcriptional regulator